MPDVAIRVEGLSKRYRIGARHPGYETLREKLNDLALIPIRAARSLASRNGNSRNGNAHRLSLIAHHPYPPLRQGETTDPSSASHWALRHVSFEVKRGEVVGIIGSNGAGKSTLLKVLSRITEPTRGCVVLHGQVGSLLEVGTGFHPELTGRENIYLNGAILGMRRRETQRKFDEIVAFAEVEKFIDTPVKHYSSGMYVRLAFAVAAHLEPDILVVDEVLSVGDESFQRKCLGKMDDVAKHGRTILFVSHNMGAITRLCQRAIWLDEGKVVMDGLSNEVVNGYNAQFLNVRPEWERPDAAKSEDEFAFLSVAVRNQKQEQCGAFSGDEPISVTVNYLVRRALAGCQIGIRVYNSEGVVVFTTSDADGSGTSALSKAPGVYESSLQIPPNFLAPGAYYLTLGAHLPNIAVYDVIEQAVVFEVSTAGSLSSLDGRLGVVTPLILWNTCKK